MAAAVASIVVALTTAAAADARTLVVGAARGGSTRAGAAASTPGRAPFSSIQTAVERARPGDWIVITAGVYHGSVLVNTPSIHIRGVNRNRVVLDGQHKIGNGIEIRADHVSVENLTVRDFDRRPGTSIGGDQILWNGGIGSAHVGLDGYRGRFLTTYDTGIAGVYGIAVSNAMAGSLDDVYASGFSGSGLFIGACRECRATIDHATATDNAVGFTAANAGGHLVLQRSTLRANAVGVELVSLATAAQPPPQDGSCAARWNRKPAPLVGSTRLSRCTHIRGDAITANNNLTAPSGAAVGPRLWGVGVEAAGSYADMVQGNFIQGNANFGILALEAPDPFPPGRPTSVFAPAGNDFAANTAAENGVLTGGADLALEGGAFGPAAIDNCFTANRFTTSIPAQIESTWGCQNARAPTGTATLMPAIQALTASSPNRHPMPQPPPGRQTTLAHPCKGPPPSSACR